MGIKKEIIRRYHATFQDGVFIKGEYFGGQTVFYDEDSEFLESVDNPADPSMGGERDVCIHSRSDNGGTVCEHRYYALPFEKDGEEYLFKRTVEVKDPAGHVTEYSEYDMDDLAYAEKFILDGNGNNVENLCEYYEEGELDSACIIRSTFDSRGLETDRVVIQVELPRYKRYKDFGGDVRGDEIERYQFEYDEDGYILKEIHEMSEGERTVHVFRYDGMHRLAEECFESPDGSKTRHAYEYGPDDILVAESTFVDDALTYRAFHVVEGTADSPRQVIQTRTENGNECYIEEIERLFY